MSVLPVARRFLSIPKGTATLREIGVIGTETVYVVIRTREVSCGVLGLLLK